MKLPVGKRFLFIAGFFTGILLVLISCHSSLYKNIQAEIDSISIKWVPDQREGICKVIVKPGKNGALILNGETNSLQARQEITNTLDNNGIIFIDSILFLPDILKNEKYRGLVSLSVINLRKLPAHNSELVSQAILGTPVLILKNENLWLLIQTPDKYIA